MSIESRNKKIDKWVHNCVRPYLNCIRFYLITYVNIESADFVSDSSLVIIILSCGHQL